MKAQLHKLLIASATLFVVVGSNPALSQEQPCRATWRAFPGQTVANGALEAVRNRACVLPINVGGTSRLINIRIAEQATRGTATAGPASIRYAPRTNFQGNDSFSIDIIWDDNAGPQQTRVTFTVTVP
jgi:hypothetical protein